MSKYDYNYDEKPAPKKRARLELWDILSIVTLLATLAVGVFFVWIFLFPNSRLNPLPPGEMIDPNAVPTATITPIILEPTWTATLQDATETPTLLPTFTLEPSPTPFSLVPPTKTPTITPTPKAPFSANVSYRESTIIHPEAACNWQGIYGTVVDSNNADMLFYQIRLIGFYNKKSVDAFTVSGMFPVNGKSGFEFVLGTTPISSKGELYIQVFDQAGLPLSEKYYLDMFTDCSKNLVLVRFKKNP